MHILVHLKTIRWDGLPQSRRMQERRAAENWRLFDSASIEWLPVAADSTCSGRLINMFNLKLDICSTFRDRFCWHHY
ncbi:hypothetical protein DBO16_09725 [Salmonella enterica subsp. enterica]|nr:hypothetical protein SEEI0720_010270 [Salmonella enterica subsp. enterica serovar Inverness str. ATCC 10720]EAM3068231.1 hypothetical protein [Salmonella enterica]ECS9019261.1 hypothetical protein [Salmonella enterica subsp. enterica serovar 4,[5],12:i:-]OSE75513.1 hypothetical protein R593_14370 [Salmonella enterica subsp. enterica serovar Newport]PUF25437.1 hypothetical protein DAX71_05590 [Salmonella enterica subsp. enterica]PUM73613.1 hypothetical protein BUJ08_19240 [Salmonella enteric